MIYEQVSQPIWADRTPGEWAQLLFAFEGQGLETKAMLQYCWTSLPQKFKNFLTLFGKVLAKYLRDIQLKLQYIDDLLIASNTYEDCLLNIITVLNHLAEKKKKGYKVSPHKTQIRKQKVTYLGFPLKQGIRSLTPWWIQSKPLLQPMSQRTRGKFVGS